MADQRSKYNQKHSPILVRSLAIDKDGIANMLQQESDSSPERKPLNLQIHEGISSTSPSTIDDWSDKESTQVIQFKAHDIDDSVPADDIEFVQNIEMPQSSGLWLNFFKGIILQCKKILK